MGGLEEENLRRLELLYGEPPDTIKEGTSEVLEWLLKEQCGLIFIEGMGSVGKTTIAMKVYEQPSVMGSFDHKVWISNGGLERGYKEVHGEILQQLTLQPRMPSLSKHEMEQVARELLPGKSILIVIDDVDDSTGAVDDRNEAIYKSWSYSFFRVVYDDFNLYGVATNSAVIITGSRSNSFTSIILKHSVVKLVPRALHLAECEGRHVMAVLEKCCHDAFAMQMFLHLLYVNPHRARVELETLCCALEENKSNAAKVMLMFCYRELPSHYMSCLLYLSIFAQGHMFRRTDLLRQWVAEGLVSKRTIGVSTLDDQAERIFDSLVIRWFIRPAETSAAGKIKSCTIHHVVHDCITTDVGFVDTSSRPDLSHRLPSTVGCHYKNLFLTLIVLVMAS